jgi:hypothetical protein
LEDTREIPHRCAVARFSAFSAAACSRSGADRARFNGRTSSWPAPSCHLRDGAGDIVVKRSAGQSVQVSGSRRWHRGHASDIKFVVNQVGNDYYVCAMWQGVASAARTGIAAATSLAFLTMFSLFHRSSDASADFTAEIPANVVVDAKTSNGSVHVDGISAGVTAHDERHHSGIERLGAARAVHHQWRRPPQHGRAVRCRRRQLTTTNGTIRAELPPKLEGASTSPWSTEW